MKKYIYLLTKTTYFVENGESYSDKQNCVFFKIDEETADKIREKVLSFNSIINGIYSNCETSNHNSYCDNYDYPSNGFEFKDGSNVLHYLKNENDYEKAKEKLKKDGYSEEFMGYIKKYYEKVKGTFYEKNMSCMYDYHDFFNLEKIEIVDLDSVENKSEFKSLF